jgi:hypothetical protein
MRLKMPDEIVRELLNANVRLTEQLVTLAGKIIENGIAQSVPQVIQPFSFSTADDWEDIPTSPRLHVREEEEDLKYQRDIGLIDSAELADALEAAGIPNTELNIS